MIHEELPYYYVGERIVEITEAQRIVVSIEPTKRLYLQNEIIHNYKDVLVCGWKGRDDIIDISVGNVNKWNSLQQILNEYKIEREDTIAFGDAKNDMEILLNAGVGVCMKNGKQELKECADYITDFDNNDNGVYRFLYDKWDLLFPNGS